MIRDLGVLRLCEDLGIPPENPAMLVFAWRCDCCRMGVFSAEEWCRGAAHLQVASAPELRACIPRLLASLNTEPDCTAIYRFAFDYTRSGNSLPGQRNIGVATIIELLRILLLDRWEHCEAFIAFLTVRIVIPPRPRESLTGTLRKKWILGAPTPRSAGNRGPGTQPGSVAQSLYIRFHNRARFPQLRRRQCLCVSPSASVDIESSCSGASPSCFCFVVPQGLSFWMSLSSGSSPEISPA
jgi:hypothetical protein